MKTNQNEAIGNDTISTGQASLKAERTFSTRKTSWEAEKTFLTRRAKLGRAWVVDLAGTSSVERLFMRTFQGMVNRDEAQLYLIHSDQPEFAFADRFWIEEYERQGWVDIAGYLTMDEAVDQFGSEIKGYVTATEKEPWSIHAAAVIAILKNGIVAPDDVAQRLQCIGWSELDNMCGRWSNAVSAFNEMVDRYGDKLAYPGLALLRHSENLWDFIMQQQIMPVFSRPKHDTWEGVARIMDAYPGQQVLYGYVSDDTVEEEIAVERASKSGKYLVPTHQVSNLSFHSAVMGRSPLLPVDEKSEEPIPALDLSKVNIAIAISDGDNLQVPILQYPLPQFWSTDKKDSISLGWSMGVSLSTLAPGIWEYYRKTIQPNDEIVSIMGIAYVHASTLPEPERYYCATFSSMTDMGLHTLWSLDSSLAITDEPLWDVLEKAPSRDVLKGVLVGYGPSIDKAFRRDTGTPVMITQNGYSENAQRIKERIEAIIAMDPADRSPVNFLMATNWDTNAEELYRTLKPLEDRGVRFLKPSQALALMPNIKGMATLTIDATASAGMCLPIGSLEQYGSRILSSPIVAEINNPVPQPLRVSIEGPREWKIGMDIECKAFIDIHVDDIARGFLIDRVLPVVEGFGLSHEFAEFAWMKLAASNIHIDLPLPETMTGGTIINMEASHIEASAVFTDGSLQVKLASFISDSRMTSPSIQVSVKFTLINPTEKIAEPTGKPANPIEMTAEPIRLKIKPEYVRFDFDLTVGIGEEDGPLVGGVRGKMAGFGANTLVDVVLEH